MNILHKIISGIVSVAVAVSSFFFGAPHQVVSTPAPVVRTTTQAPANLGAAPLYVVAKPTTLYGGGISSSDTSIKVTAFVTPTGTAITTAQLVAGAGNVFYITIEPATTKKETVSCTGVTQNGDGTALLTGCIRGLSFTTPYTAVAALALSHSGGSSVVMSNPAQLYNDIIAYIQATSQAGVVNDASLIAKGIGELSTGKEAASTTAIGGGNTSAPLILYSTIASSTYTSPLNGSTGLNVVVTQNNNQIDPSFTQFATTTIAGETIAANDAVCMKGNDQYSIDLASVNSNYYNTPSVVGSYSFATGTVSIWFNPTTVSANSVLAGNSNNANKQGWRMWFDANGLLSFILGDGSSAKVVASSTVPAGQWTNVTATWDNVSATIYINGNLVNTSNVWGVITNGDNQTGIGAYLIVPNQFFNGKIDNVRIWNARLSASDVAAKYKLEQSSDTNLRGSWKFNNDLTDSTGLSTVLTATNPGFFTSTSTSFDIPSTGGTSFIRCNAALAASSTAFIGFALNAAATNGQVRIQTAGVMTGFTGLTSGSPYYLSTTAGGISLSPGSTTRRVGTSMGTTNLVISNSF